jgi:hypothetical protein
MEQRFSTGFVREVKENSVDVESAMRDNVERCEDWIRSN